MARESDRPRARASHKEMPSQIGGRHTFAHERVLVLIAGNTRDHGCMSLSKREISEVLHLNPRTVDRALMQLRHAGSIESIPRFSESGSQLGNEYRATEAGVMRAMEVVARAFGIDLSGHLEQD